MVIGRAGSPPIDEERGFVPKILVTDKLHPYAGAFRRLRLACRISSARIAFSAWRVAPLVRSHQARIARDIGGQDRG